MNKPQGEAHFPSPLAGEGDSPSGERGEGVLRSRAKAMRHTPTPAELALWYLLRDRRFAAHKFRRQVPIGTYIVDFLCYEQPLIVEADGGQHADNLADAARTRWLEAQGYCVLRFWNHQILTDREAVALQLHHALSSPSPRSPAASRPLPRGERGERAT